MSYKRFAIYYLPPSGALANFGASWLGWDVALGQRSSQLDVQGLNEVTSAPRKYGFHGTLKPPFRLAEAHTVSELDAALTEWAQTCAPASADALELVTLGRFLALVPSGETGGLSRVAAACVTALDRFRAVPSEAELARRRKPHLTERQNDLLTEWGYPYVLDQFRFHMTLTDRVPKADLAHWKARAAEHLPELPSPFCLNEVALCGERSDGQFEEIGRVALTR